MSSNKPRFKASFAWTILWYFWNFKECNSDITRIFVCVTLKATHAEKANQIVETRFWHAQYFFKLWELVRQCTTLVTKNLCTTATHWHANKNTIWNIFSLSFVFVAFDERFVGLSRTCRSFNLNKLLQNFFIADYILKI